MELNDLVEQIAAKVAERLSDMEGGIQLAELLGCSEGESCQKPKLLILSESHDELCLPFFEKDSIKQKFDVVCAADSNYACDLESVEMIVLRNFSNTSLAKVAQGIGDTPFTELVIQAILMGKQLIIPEEELELYEYRETAPKLYYSMMLQKVDYLKNAGVRFCSCGQLESLIMGMPVSEESRSCAKEPEVMEEKTATGSSEIASEMKCTKKILTEQDLRQACQHGIAKIYIEAKTIITDLAREYAEQKGISFIKG